MIVALGCATISLVLISYGILANVLLSLGEKMSEELEVLKEIRDELKELKEKISEPPGFTFIESGPTLEPKCNCPEHPNDISAGEGWYCPVHGHCFGNYGYMSGCS